MAVTTQLSHNKNCPNFAKKGDLGQRLRMVKAILQAAKNNRWVVIAVGIWIQCVSGASYDFSVYSQLLKASLHFNQQQLDTVSFFKDIGANVGVVSGLLYDSVPPWIILAIAACLNFFGYFMMWLSISHKITPSPPLWQICIYMCLAANAQTFANTATVVTCVKIFPNHRGTVVGLMKGFLGLSGAVLVQIYNAIYSSYTRSFVLLVSWLNPAICTAFMFIIRPLPVFENGNEKRRLDKISVIALALACYLFGVTIIERLGTFGRLWSLLKCLVMIFILLLPLLVALKADVESSTLANICEAVNISSENRPLLCGTDCERASSIVDPNMPQTGGTANTRKQNYAEKDQTLIYTSSSRKKYLNNFSWKAAFPEKLKTKRGENFTLLQAILVTDFWILFFGTACGMGSGNTTINNMSQLGLSLGYGQNKVATLVSLWSIWNFLGRFGAGYISEFFLHWKGVARPLFISITLAAMGFGHLMIGAALPGALYFGSMLVGICYGAQWSLMPATASELFGLKHFGTLFNTVAIASPLGSYLLSVKLAGYLYDLEAKKSNTFLTPKFVLSSVSESLSCYGSHCFRLTFFIMAVVCFCGCIASFLLFIRTKTFYKTEIYERIQNRES